MDGYKKDKTNLWRKNYYSDTRYAVIKWLERELPKITGNVLNLAAGGWPVPKMLLTNPGLKKYLTFDRKHYGDSKNPVNVYGDAHNLPGNWNNTWDCIIMNQALECMQNPFKVTREIYRVLKVGGIALIDTPFNVSWFGHGSTPESLKKKFAVNDYWRITPQGIELLLVEAGFNKNNITIEVSGPNKWNPYCIMAKAIK